MTANQHHVPTALLVAIVAACSSRDSETVGSVAAGDPSPREDATTSDAAEPSATAPGPTVTDVPASPSAMGATGSSSPPPGPTGASGQTGASQETGASGQTSASGQTGASQETGVTSEQDPPTAGPSGATRSAEELWGAGGPTGSSQILATERWGSTGELGPVMPLAEEDSVVEGLSTPALDAGASCSIGEMSCSWSGCRFDWSCGSEWSGDGSLLAAERAGVGGMHHAGFWLGMCDIRVEAEIFGIHGFTEEEEAQAAAALVDVCASGELPPPPTDGIGGCMPQDRDADESGYCRETVLCHGAPADLAGVSVSRVSTIDAECGYAGISCTCTSAEPTLPVELPEGTAEGSPDPCWTFALECLGNPGFYPGVL